MNSVTSQITNALQSSINKIVQLDNVTPELEKPADPAHGDYSSNCAMVLFTKLSPELKDRFRNPRQLAEEIVSELHQQLAESVVKEVSVAGPGFINFRLSDEALLAYLQQVVRQDWSSLKVTSPEESTAIVEYSSPNIAKPFTVGHLRSTIIGDAVANLLQAAGWKVFRDNHLGEWGTQFGKQI